MDENKIIQEVSQYYTEKIKKYGSSPQGVDWNSLGSQELRFKQLIKIIDDTHNPFSILDFGCGYGSLLKYLQRYFSEFSYSGYDISEEMIRQAQKNDSSSNIKWHQDIAEIKPHDYVVASGIFNVRLNNAKNIWEDYILKTLHQMNDLAIKGFSFNILTHYSDAGYMKDYLYYADPCFIFDYCKKNFAKEVALFHDYPLYEFTILVRKEI